MTQRQYFTSTRVFISFKFMTATQNCFNNLPFEALLKVFESATKSEIREYALVCKAWLDPAQVILYSNVELRTPAHLKTFSDATKHKPLLGERVKVLRTDRYLGYGLSEGDEVSTLLSDLLYYGLPNLQELDDHCFETYAPILRALQDSRLKNLKVLSPPESYATNDVKRNYLSCILLMRNRVAKVTLQPMSDSSPDSLIYNELDQLNQLEEVDITGCDSPRWFETLEHVTASCKNLKKLNFNLTGGTVNHVHVDVDAVTPSINVESVNAQITQNDMLLYLMKKFPRLRELSLHHFFDYVPENPEQLTRILTYLSSIDVFKVERFPVDHGISVFTANYWDKASAELGSKTVEVCYYDLFDEGNGLELFKQKGESGATLSFIFGISYQLSEHLDLINNLGKYIGEFHFKYVAESEMDESPSKRDLPSGFIDRIFRSCPRLRALHFVGWVFRKAAIAHKELPIGELYFKECIIYGDFFKNLSSRLPHLNRLIIEKAAYVAGNKRSKSNYEHEYSFNNTLEIDMPQTQIETVTLHRSKSPTSYVKLFVASEKTHHFYGYKGILFETSEKEYNAAQRGDCVYISCFNKPKIQVKHLE